MAVTVQDRGGRAEQTAAQSELRALDGHRVLLLARDGNGVCLPGVWIEQAMVLPPERVLRLALDEDFVRKSPGVAIGLAAVAGFLVARLFKGGSND